MCASPLENDLPPINDCPSPLPLSRRERGLKYFSIRERGDEARTVFLILLGTLSANVG